MTPAGCEQAVCQMQKTFADNYFRLVRQFSNYKSEIEVPIPRLGVAGHWTERWAGRSGGDEVFSAAVWRRRHSTRPIVLEGGEPAAAIVFSQTRRSRLSSGLGVGPCHVARVLSRGRRGTEDGCVPLPRPFWRVGSHEMNDLRIRASCSSTRGLSASWS
jgi:hypothetical protein